MFLLLGGFVAALCGLMITVLLTVSLLCASIFLTLLTGTGAVIAGILMYILFFGFVFLPFIMPFLAILAVVLFITKLFKRR
jgi:hypothetical protein